MRPLLTAAETRAAEAEAEARGLPPSILMETAGAAVADVAARGLAPAGRVLVVAGPGNNGGDGFVAARRLHAAGVRVDVWRVGDASALRGDAARNHQALGRTGVPLHASAAALPLRAGDVVVDALFGTGLSRAPEGAAADAIRQMLAWRAAGVRVVAVDLPSGLSSDTGTAFSPAVVADETVTFGAAKLGLALEPGATLAGEVTVADIGLGSVRPTAWLLEDSDGPRLLPARRSDTHKGTYGHVLVVAGSPGKSGAAALAGMGALRGGAGLCTLAASTDALAAAQAHAPELMGVALPPGALGSGHLDALLAAAEGKSALVIGPGIARGEGTPALLGELLARVGCPVVLDADALNAVAADLSVLARARTPLVLTPHPGEMARLVGQGITDVQADRLGQARRFAAAHRCVLVLKGARTLVALPDGSVRVNPSGNPGMATGGTGDVLAGLLGALLAQGLAAADAASVAVLAHGLAGDRAAATHGQVGLVASDLLGHLGGVWRAWNR